MANIIHLYSKAGIYKSDYQIEIDISRILLVDYPITDVVDMLHTAKIIVNGFLIFVIYDNDSIDVFKLTNNEIEWFNIEDIPREVSVDDIITLSNSQYAKARIRNEKINKLMDNGKKEKRKK